MEQDPLTPFRQCPVPEGPVNDFMASSRQNGIRSLDALGSALKPKTKPLVYMTVKGRIIESRFVSLLGDSTRSLSVSESTSNPDKEIDVKKVTAVLAVVATLFALAGIACGEATATPDAKRTPTLGEKVAAIDGESMDSAHAKRAEYLLPKIAEWCSGSVSAERVGDMAVKGKEILLEQYGIEVDVLEVLEGVNESTVGTGGGVLDCEEVFALYVVLRGQ